MSQSEDSISLPVKVDRSGRVIVGPQKAFRWKLDIPASFTGTTRQRPVFLTETEAKQKRAQLLAGRTAASGNQLSELARKGLTVEDAISYALKHVPTVSELTVGELLERFLTHRKQEIKISDRYAATLESYSKRIREAMGDRKIHLVCRNSVREFLGNLTGRDGASPASVKTRNHYLETLRAVFGFAKTEGLLAKSPTEGISTAKADPDPVKCLSVEETTRLLAALKAPEHSEVAPAALLQLFAGIRRCEIPLLDWRLISEDYIRLDSVKRGTKFRPIEMPQCLKSWIKPFRKTSGFVFQPKAIEQTQQSANTHTASRSLIARNLEDAYAWRLHRAGREAGVALPKNILRHTAITMRVNLTKNISEVSRWAGNTPDIVCSHYLGSATPDDARRFYALLPENTAEADASLDAPSLVDPLLEDHAVAV